jgi:hypothetical protein
MSVSRWSIAGAFLLCAASLLITNPRRAEAVNVGDVGPMFQTLDENMQPVDTATLIVDRPLVIIVGSAS